MIYLTNFISNIKRICINIKYVLCYDLHKLFNNINSKANDNGTRIDVITWSDLIDVDERIKKIYQKLEKYQVGDIDMMKIYIEENSNNIKDLKSDIKGEILNEGVINRKNTIENRKLFKDINSRLENIEEEIKDLINEAYPHLTERLDTQAEQIQKLQIFLMENNHVFNKSKDK